MHKKQKKFNYVILYAIINISAIFLGGVNQAMEGHMTILFKALNAAKHLVKAPSANAFSGKSLFSAQSSGSCELPLAAKLMVTGAFTCWLTTLKCAYDYNNGSKDEKKQLVPGR